MYHQLFFGVTCVGILAVAGLLPLPERAALPKLSLSDINVAELGLPEASGVIAGIGEIVSDLPEMGANIQENVIAPSVERLSAALNPVATSRVPVSTPSLATSEAPASMPATPSVAIETVTFDLDAFELDIAAKAQLDRFAQQLAVNPAAKLGIYGHTDLTGEERYNTDLGKSRAEQVAAYLADKGISRDRIAIIKSYGESAPTVPTDAPSRVNRRVIIEVL